jgi:hypothetical protein
MYLCYTMYIVKAKENSREFVWKQSWFMENGVVNGGKEGKCQGTEGSANAIDVWVWMMPHLRFCTIGNCDHLSFFLLIKSLPAPCKFYPLFLSQNMELFN